jgi:hypothetical protein
MQQPVAHISQILFQQEVFLFTSTLNADSRSSRQVSQGNDTKVVQFLNFLYKTTKINECFRLLTIELPICKKNAMEIQQAVVHHKLS